MQRSYSDAVGDQPFSHRDCGIALYERMPTIENRDPVLSDVRAGMVPQLQYC